MRQRLMLSIIFFLPVSVLFSQQTKFIISAGNSDRTATPVSFRSAKSLPPGEYLLTDVQRKKQFAATVLPGSVVSFVLPEKLAAGTERTYHLQRRDLRRKKFAEIKSDTSGISIEINGREVLFYHTSAARPPADSPAYYQRSGFIHPLRSPSGKILTDDFPAGHAHQHGIMMAWANTVFKKSNIDFWNQQNKTGNVRHAKLLAVDAGSSVLQVKLELEHYSILYGVVLKETWTIRCYPFSDYYLFDLISEQQNITSDSLILKKYHYGGMEFRGSREWNEDDRKNFTNKWSVRTDAGFDTSNANAQPAAFVDVSGKVEGKYCGVTIFSFPSNFRYPEPIRLHPVMPYWCFAPAVSDGFAIAPAGRHLSRYRYYVYDGRPDVKMIGSIQNDVRFPPVITEIP